MRRPHGTRDSTVEQALLAKGYHIVIVGMEKKRWGDIYKLLVDNGFSSKPVLKGTGPKAGEAYAWAIANPGRVSCIYARNASMHSLQAGNAQPIDNLAALAKANVPVLHDCGARGGLIGFAPDPRTGHQCSGSRYMAIPYLDACLAARLPDKGSKSQTPKPMDTRHAWLAPLLGDPADPAAHYKGNPLEAVWLPNAAVAKAARLIHLCPQSNY